MNSVASLRNVKQPFSSHDFKSLGSRDAASRLCAEFFRGFEDFSFNDGSGNAFLNSASIRTSAFRLSSVHSSGHRISLRETDSCAVLLPLRGSIRISTGDRQLAASPGQGIIALPGRRNTEVGPDYLGLVCVIDKPDQEDPVLLLRPSPQLRTFLQYVADAFESSPYIVENASAHRSIASLISELIDQSRLEPDAEIGQSCASLGLERHVIAAEAWMDAHMADVFSVSGLARELEINVRTLQLAFQRHRNCTPREAIERRRLECVRQALLQGSPQDSVTAVAMDNGVLHLGRFAASYRRLYGENPSQTLARAQRKRN